MCSIAVIDWVARHDCAASMHGKDSVVPWVAMEQPQPGIEMSLKGLSGTSLMVGVAAGVVGGEPTNRPAGRGRWDRSFGRIGCQHRRQRRLPHALVLAGALIFAGCAGQASSSSDVELGGICEEMVTFAREVQQEGDDLQAEFEATIDAIPKLDVEAFQLAIFKEQQSFSARLMAWNKSHTAAGDALMQRFYRALTNNKDAPADVRNAAERIQQTSQDVQNSSTVAGIIERFDKEFAMLQELLAPLMLVENLDSFVELFEPIAQELQDIEDRMSGFEERLDRLERAAMQETKQDRQIVTNYLRELPGCTSIAETL